MALSVLIKYLREECARYLGATINLPVIGVIQTVGTITDAILSDEFFR